MHKVGNSAAKRTPRNSNGPRMASGPHSCCKHQPWDPSMHWVRVQFNSRLGNLSMSSCQKEFSKHLWHFPLVLFRPKPSGGENHLQIPWCEHVWRLHLTLCIWCPCSFLNISLSLSCKNAFSPHPKCAKSKYNIYILYSNNFAGTLAPNIQNLDHNE